MQDINSSAMSADDLRIVAYTIGLMAAGGPLKRPALVKVFMSGQHGGAITLAVENARNLARIRGIGPRVISWDEFEDRPRGDIELARWAFAQFGLSV